MQITPEYRRHRAAGVGVCQRRGGRGALAAWGEHVTDEEYAAARRATGAPAG